MQTTNRTACQPNASNATACQPDASGQPGSRRCDHGIQAAPKTSTHNSRPSHASCQNLPWADSAVGRWPGTTPCQRPALRRHRRAHPAASSARGRMPQRAPNSLEAAHAGHCPATTPVMSGQYAGTRAGARVPAARAALSQGRCGEGSPARPQDRRWRATAWRAGPGRRWRPTAPVRQSAAGTGAGRDPVASRFLRVSPGARHRRGWWLHPAVQQRC